MFLVHPKNNVAIAAPVKAIKPIRFCGYPIKFTPLALDE